jgi:hypothetical protein
MKIAPINTVITMAMRHRMTGLEAMFNKGPEFQERWLRKLLEMGRHTEYGRQHGFKDLANSAAFASQVPLQDYPGLLPYIERMRTGEQQVLWPTHIKWFAKSSGTTGGRSKFLPVSYEAFEACHFNGGKDLLAIYCSLFPDTRLFAGFSLRLGGSTSINSTNHESYFGDLSALMIENLPFWIEIRSTPNQRVALLDEWETKIEAISKQTIRQNVTSLFGVPSWMLVLCKRILEITGKSHMHEVWPNMELYAHGGVSFAPYRKQFEGLFPNNTRTFLETYNASEGFFAIQDDPARDDMVLLVNHGIYYEFMPFSDQSDSATPVPLEGIQLGVNYAMIITTNSGLWRYQIGDTVRFTSVNPYRIQISGRTKHFINAFGEELIIDNAEKAIRAVGEQLGITVIDYTAGPIYMEGQSAGAHEWMIEFEQPPSDLDLFVEHFDKALQEVNSDYEAKRHKNMALRLPVIHVARPGLFYSWLRKHNKLGGQHKIPRLMNERSLMDELLQMNQT